MLEVTQGGSDRSDKCEWCSPKINTRGTKCIVPIVSVCPVGRAAIPPLYTEGQWAQCLVQNAQDLEW